MSLGFTSSNVRGGAPQLRVGVELSSTQAASRKKAAHTTTQSNVSFNLSSSGICARLAAFLGILALSTVHIVDTFIVFGDFRQECEDVLTTLAQSPNASAVFNTTDVNGVVERIVSLDNVMSTIIKPVSVCIFVFSCMAFISWIVRASTLKGGCCVNETAASIFGWIEWFFLLLIIIGFTATASVRFVYLYLSGTDVQQIDVSSTTVSSNDFQAACGEPGIALEWISVAGVSLTSVVLPQGYPALDRLIKFVLSLAK